MYILKDNFVIVTGYKDMNFEDKDGKSIDMIKISFLSQNNGNDSVGFLPIQQSFMDDDKKEILTSLKNVPGLYKAEYDIVPGKNNRATLTIVGFTYVKDVDLKTLFKVS